MMWLWNGQGYDSGWFDQQNYHIQNYLHQNELDMVLSEYFHYCKTLLLLPLPL